jgi:hypothetical protein
MLIVGIVIGLAVGYRLGGGRAIRHLADSEHRKMRQGAGLDK